MSRSASTSNNIAEREGRSWTATWDRLRQISIHLKPARTRGEIAFTRFYFIETDGTPMGDRLVYVGF